MHFSRWPVCVQREERRTLHCSLSSCCNGSFGVTTGNRATLGNTEYTWSLFCPRQGSFLKFPIDCFLPATAGKQQTRQVVFKLPSPSVIALHSGCGGEAFKILLFLWPWWMVYLVNCFLYGLNSSQQIVVFYCKKRDIGGMQFGFYSFRYLRWNLFTSHSSPEEQWKLTTDKGGEEVRKEKIIAELTMVIESVFSRKLYFGNQDFSKQKYPFEWSFIYKNRSKLRCGGGSRQSPGPTALRPPKGFCGMQDSTILVKIQGFRQQEARAA